MEGMVLLKCTQVLREFAYNRHVGGIDCFAFELCNGGYVE